MKKGKFSGTHQIKTQILGLFVTCLVLFPLFGYSQPEFLFKKQFDTAITDFYTDKLQNVFLVTPDNEVIKYIPSLQQEFRFSNNFLGDLGHIDTNNPFNILLFYPEYNTVISLDRNMIETGKFNLFDLNLLQVNAIAVSSDNHIWLYDQLEFKLKKVDNAGKTLVESGDLSLQLNQSLRPNFLVEKEQKVYVNDPEIGILIFDIFGQYETTLDFKNLQEFQIIGNELLFFEHEKLQSFHLQSLLVKSVELPKEMEKVDKIQIRKNRIYALKDEFLRVYEF